MKNEIKINVDEAMTEIRKAYRLIYTYQSRILNLASYIGAQFNLSKAHGHSLFSASYKDNDNIDFEYWAWDWLPMYAYLFYFDGDKNNDLGVVVITDSLAFGADEENPKSFGKPEDSETKVYLLATNGKVTVDQIYEEVQKLSSDRLKSISLPDKEGNQIDIHLKGYSIELFAENDSTDKILAEFKKKVSEKGIQF